MADPTLFDYAKSQLERAVAEQVNAQKRLEAADSVAKERRESLAAATQRRQDLQKHEAAVRKSLPDIETAADGDALVNELELIIIARRAASAAVLDAATAQTLADADRSRAADARAQAQQAVASAQDLLRAATERGGRLEAMTKALTSLGGIAAAADNADSGPERAAARARIEADFPPTLLEQARKRLDRVRVELRKTQEAASAADDAVTDAVVDVGGLEASLARLWQRLRRADDAVSTYVATAQERFDRALAALKSIAAGPPLTPKEAAQIVALATDSGTLTAEVAALDFDTSPTSTASLEETLAQARLAASKSGVDCDALLAAAVALRAAKAATAKAAEAVDAAEQKVQDAITASAEPDPEDDPKVIEARRVFAAKAAELVVAEKAEEKASENLAAAKTAAGDDAVSDALLAAYDQLKGAEDTVSAARAAWDEKEAAWHDAEASCAAAKAELADAEAVARKKNVKPEDDTTVQAARTHVADALTALDGAKAAYRSSGKGKLHVWEVALPDGAWQSLADFEEASSLLVGLGSGAGALTADQTAAESALVTELAKVDDLRRKAALLERESLARAAETEALARDRAARLLAALRGDR